MARLRGDRETATLLRHQSVAMKCTGDNTAAQSSVEKQKVSGRFGQLSRIIGRQSSKLSYMKCYESGVSERSYTLIPVSDAIARLLAAVSDDRTQEHPKGQREAYSRTTATAASWLSFIEGGPRTPRAARSLIHQSWCAQAWAASL